MNIPERDRANTNLVSRKLLFSHVSHQCLQGDDAGNDQLTEARLLATACFVILALILPLLLYAQAMATYEHGWELEGLLCLPLLAWASFGMTFRQSRGHETLLGVFFWMFVYIFLGLAPLGMALLGYYGKSGLSRESVDIAFAAVYAGILAYECGRAIGNVRVAGRIAPRVTLRVSCQRVVWFNVLTLVLVGACVALAGGVGALLITRGEFEGAGTVDRLGKSGGLLFTALLRVPSFISLALTLALRRRAKERNDQGRVELLTYWACVLIPVNCLANFPLALPRFWLGTVVLGIAGILFRPTVSRRIVTATCLTVLLAVVFPLADVTRGKELTHDVSFDSPAETLVFKGDFDAFAMLVRSVDYVHTRGVDFGWQGVGAILFFVPRDVWTSKPMDSGEMLGAEDVMPNRNLSTPLWGEAFLSGHVVGVFLWFVVYGFISQRLERSSSRPWDGVLLFADVAAPVLAAFQVFLLRGDLMNAFSFLVPMVVCMVTCCTVWPWKPELAATHERKAWRVARSAKSTELMGGTHGR